MKTVEYWLNEIREADLYRDDATRDLNVSEVVRQIQADARTLPPPDVPRGTLLEDAWAKEIEASFAGYQTDQVCMAVPTGEQAFTHGIKPRITVKIEGKGDCGVAEAVSERRIGSRKDLTLIGQVFQNLYTAHQNLPALLAERSRLIGLLRDLSLDGATERYNAGYAAGRQAYLTEIREKLDATSEHAFTPATVQGMRHLLDAMEEQDNADVTWDDGIGNML